MKSFRDYEHLFRLGSVFLVGFFVFIIARAFLVPRSFGQYGHYRGDAIAEIAARPVAYAGHQTCEGCHTDVVDVKSKGKHTRVACESCHGPLATHADDPTSVQPEKLDTLVLCARCHEASNSKPRWFPQVVSADHSSGLACNTCHQPHSPKIETPEAKSVAKNSAGKPAGAKR